jgi:hypothetical protein
MSVCFTPKAGFAIWAPRQKLNLRQTEKYFAIQSSSKIPAMPGQNNPVPGNMNPYGQPSASPTAPYQLPPPSIYPPSAPQQLPPPSVYPPAAPKQQPGPANPPMAGTAPYMPPANAVSANYPAPPAMPPDLPVLGPVPTITTPPWAMSPNYPTNVSYNSVVQPLAPGR